MQESLLTIQRQGEPALMQVHPPPHGLAVGVLEAVHVAGRVEHRGDVGHLLLEVGEDLRLDPATGVSLRGRTPVNASPSPLLDDNA